MSAEQETDKYDLSDLPSHPNDRVTPGYSMEERDRLHELVSRADEAVGHGQMIGLVAVATTTVHVQAEDEGVAGEQAVNHVDSGDLSPGWYGWPEEIGEADDDRFLSNWYSRQDEDYPLYEARLVAAGRFYMWAHDGAQVGEVAPAIIDGGDFGGCVVVNHWPASVKSVDVSRLAVQRAGLERRLAEVEDGDSA